MIVIEKEHLCVVGDIHGELGTLVYNITEQYRLEDTAFIIAGDVGLGFNQPGWYDAWYKKQESRLEKNRNIIYGIRGNHDDPEFFNGEKALDYPYLKTLKDYEPIMWKDKIILPVGGATSIDYKERLIENSKFEKKRLSKRCWWPGERPIVIDFKDLPGHIDIIISHEAPNNVGRLLIKKPWMTNDLYEKIKEERDYLYRLLKETNPERWYFGHYHESFSGHVLNTDFKGLDINEIMEVIYYDENSEIE